MDFAFYSLKLYDNSLYDAEISERARGKELSCFIYKSKNAKHTHSNMHLMSSLNEQSSVKTETNFKVKAFWICELIEVSSWTQCSNKTWCVI